MELRFKPKSIMRALSHSCQMMMIMMMMMMMPEKGDLLYVQYIRCLNK